MWLLPNQAGLSKGKDWTGWQNLAQPSTLMQHGHGLGTGEDGPSVDSSSESLVEAFDGGGGAHSSPLRRIKAGAGEDLLTSFFKTAGDRATRETPLAQKGCALLHLSSTRDMDHALSSALDSSCMDLAHGPVAVLVI